MQQKHHEIEVWAQLNLCPQDELRIRQFLAHRWGIRGHRVARHLHLTVYHSRRLIPDLLPSSEPANVLVTASQTRFMVLTPGGENPRPELVPAEQQVGIRVQRQSPAWEQIMQYRDRMLGGETPAVLGGRRPSTRRRSAFGARQFQPHMTLLRRGSGVERDLKQIGTAFRESIGDMRFDRFEVHFAQGPGRVTRNPR
jgi:hypothetical protein